MGVKFELNQEIEWAVYANENNGIGGELERSSTFHRWLHKPAPVPRLLHLALSFLRLPAAPRLHYSLILYDFR